MGGTESVQIKTSRQLCFVFFILVHAVQIITFFKQSFQILWQFSFFSLI